MRLILTVALSLFMSGIFGAAAIAAQPASATAPEGIIGTWRLVSFEDVEDGKVIRRFGEKPVGLASFLPRARSLLWLERSAGARADCPLRPALGQRHDVCALFAVGRSGLFPAWMARTSL